ncbi:hypothetical protein NPA31_007310 [Aurantimonas sp. MSK8Z-1]|uniref:hypothetical protein n=1 Tax=Mangrovibrevibacter kandeliae TaxID=2968473 RepID=UPI002118AAB0|nr:hypothetical protein [Aurantimonas sp. MSK8Z-1]MCW4114770.1 hypothetical protein [Aurantimonas sp. MSK8Z-1]
MIERTRRSGRGWLLIGSADPIAILWKVDFFDDAGRRWFDGNAVAEAGRLPDRPDIFDAAILLGPSARRIEITVRGIAYGRAHFVSREKRRAWLDGDAEISGSEPAK